MITLTVPTEEHHRAVTRIFQRPTPSKPSQALTSNTPLLMLLLAEMRLKSLGVLSGPSGRLSSFDVCRLDNVRSSANSRFVARLYATDCIMTGPV